jgi:hypothetical protein
MNHYTANDIYMLNTYYLQYYCQTEAHYAFIPTIQKFGLGIV